MVKAEVQVKSCIISGALVGNVTATESIEITKEGRMVGDISAPRVVIVDGAGFRGRIDTGEVDVEEGAERPRWRAPPPGRRCVRPPRATYARPQRQRLSASGPRRATAPPRSRSAPPPA